jgi:hypothetical protein
MNRTKYQFELCGRRDSGVGVVSAWLEEEQAVGAHFDSMEMCLALRSTLLAVRASDTTLPAETRMLVRRALVTHLETVARLATSAAQYQVILVLELVVAQMCSALLWKQS